jgi:hypothetical protein
MVQTESDKPDSKARDMNFSSPWIWPVFFQSLALSLGLTVAIGAQNAFVLRQGLRREQLGRQCHADGWRRPEIQLPCKTSPQS